jgi:hypothetical protein
MKGGRNYTTVPFNDITDEFETSYENQLEDALCQIFINNNVDVVSRSGENGLFQIEFNEFSLLHVPEGEYSRIEFHEKGEPYYTLIITFDYSTTMSPNEAANDIYRRGEIITPFYGDNTSFKQRWCD